MEECIKAFFFSFRFSWVPVIEYIESKYEEFLNAESRVVRRQIPDSRVHCCLYFVAPSGHGLKPLDVEFMQRLHDKVNIIPVIAKADTMTPDECAHFKKQVSQRRGRRYYCQSEVVNTSRQIQSTVILRIKKIFTVL